MTLKLSPKLTCCRLAACSSFDSVGVLESHLSVEIDRPLYQSIKKDAIGMMFYQKSTKVTLSPSLLVQLRSCRVSPASCLLTSLGVALGG
jgi:hypothetical protein